MISVQRSILVDATISCVFVIAGGMSILTFRGKDK
jgi:hypothetical protein